MNKKKNITTLIFDLGGVLVNLYRDRCVRSFQEIGIPVMEDLLSTTLQRGFILDFEKGTIDDTQFREELRKLSVQAVSNSEINHAWLSLLGEIPEHKLSALKELKKNYKILMLSNTNSISFEYCLNSLFNVDGNSIDDYFHKCYLSYKMGMHKPNRDIFMKLLEDEKLKAEECLFLDDATNNIKTAASLGFHTQLIRPNTDEDLLKIIQL